MSEEKKEKELIDFGCANNWSETPPLVEECDRLKHQKNDIDVGPPNRGLDHRVACKICGYKYWYDSSD